MGSTRFVIIDKGRLPLPAKCWCCGAADRDCVDWGADIGFQGAILLCVVCLAEAATLLKPDVDTEKLALKSQLSVAVGELGRLRGDLLAVLNAASFNIDAARILPVPEHAGATTLSK